MFLNNTFTEVLIAMLLNIKSVKRLIKVFFNLSKRANIMQNRKIFDILICFLEDPVSEVPLD